MRRPPVVLGLALITVLALCVALGLILFSVNPTTSDNQKEIKGAQADIEKAVMSQKAIICAQVQNTANAYRFRSLTPSGDVEPIRHFLTRMQAQQQTLRLARGSECKSAPGFPPVGLQVRRALNQIKRILENFGPKLKEPISSNLPSSMTPRYKQGGSSSPLSGLSKGGVDESGIPATLKPHVAPSAPTEPETGREHKTEEPEATPAEPMPQDANGGAPGTNVAQEADSERPSSSTPANVEARLNPPEVKIELEIP